MEQKKKLPLSVRKKELVEMYLGQMPEYKIINAINTIILATKNKQYKKTDRIIYAKEFKEFVDIYDMPLGYEE